ncbi:hypothetical protein SODALDRAFT_395054, partial [Sodiomyces alkalinus F11]
EMVDCKACNRSFGSLESLGQHDSSKHRSIYCERCRRFFSYPQAKQQHIVDSPRHNICHFCSDKPDFHSDEDLTEHLVEEHNMCDICERMFSQPLAMKPTCDTLDIQRLTLHVSQHRKTHAAKNTECYGCDRRFTSRSAMVLHLEAGTCESGVDADFVTQRALEYPRRYVYLCTDDPDFDFKCPACERPFTWMSGLLQHVENAESCNTQQDAWEPLLGFLSYLARTIRRT